jgi:formiminotetrahydrofolate cyclodeaminase
MSSIDLWRPAYLAAVCETDDSRMMTRIMEARAAIEQRLLLPIDEDSEEYRAIKAARNALDVLKSERVDNIPRRSD